MNDQNARLSNENIVNAAKTGVQLLNTPGAVNVPGPISVTDAMKHLNFLLTAIATGSAVLVDAPKAQESEDGKTPPDNDGKQKPDLKKIEGGKES